MLKARQGRIICISSVVGQSGNPGQANYAASKAGLIGFAKSVALEVASRGITVNVVAPGLIDTDMTRAISNGAHEDWAARIPLKRLGTPDDIAAAVLEYYRLGIHSFLLRGFENPHDTMAIGRDLIPLIKAGALAIDRQAEAAE